VMNDPRGFQQERKDYREEDSVVMYDSNLPVQNARGTSLQKERGYQEESRLYNHSYADESNSTPLRLAVGASLGQSKSTQHLFAR